MQSFRPSGIYLCFIIISLTNFALRLLDTGLLSTIMKRITTFEVTWRSLDYTIVPVRYYSVLKVCELIISYP
jgi:hypothetical protein